jgi:hypothetical protein
MRLIQGDKINKVIFYPFLVLLVYILTVIVNHPDFDLWARLAVGSLFFQTGWVLNKDIFAYVPTKELWIDHEWGSGVVFFWITNIFGNTGIFILKGLLLFIIFFLIVRIIKLQIGKGLNVEILYISLLAFSMLPSIANTLRSQLFTFLFFTLWIYVLERVRKGENRLLWILPITMIIWANMHGGFVAGLGLILIYGIGELLNKRNPLKYFGILIVTVLVTLINPYGIKYWPYIIEATTMPRPLISEWKPISMSGPIHIIYGAKIHVLTGYFIFILLTFIAAVKSVLNRYKYDWVKIIFIIITFCLSIKHQRHDIFFILFVSGLLYTRYIELFTNLKKFIQVKFGEIPALISVWTKDILSYMLIIALCINLVPTLPKEILTRPLFYPVGSFEFIKQNNLSGNLATTYGWGSYALWKLYPQCRVLIDGRYEEVYPNRIYNIAINFSEHNDNNWREFLNYFHTDIIVAPKLKYTPQDIHSLENWKIVYEDQISVVLLPKDKIKDYYVYPSFKNKIYWREDLSKHVDLN